MGNVANMGHISERDWASFKSAIDISKDDFADKPTIWKRLVASLNRFQEDEAQSFDDIPLPVQCNYNYMRSWPISQFTPAGELDKQSAQLLINKTWLREHGYLNAADYWDANFDYDRLVMDGFTWKMVGDTSVSQIKDDDLFISVIVKREEKPTG